MEQRVGLGRNSDSEVSWPVIGRNSCQLGNFSIGSSVQVILNDLASGF
jgi:hypothetical protein